MEMRSGWRKPVFVSLVVGGAFVIGSLFPKQEAHADPGKGDGKFALYSGPVGSGKDGGPAGFVMMKIDTESGESWILTATAPTNNFTGPKGGDPVWIPVKK
ncbi:MAG: hypothetical protein IT452_16430 [Planctomycetia bacterium]|nr:hypothetical protein [Planctomycetia bacterium]